MKAHYIVLAKSWPPIVMLLFTHERYLSVSGPGVRPKVDHECAMMVL